jgi:hypothetical protein
MGAVTFSQALELIESLPEEECRDLLDIVRRRLVEERRAEIAKSIQAARGEWARGEVKGGTVDDLLRELPNEATRRVTWN